LPLKLSESFQAELDHSRCRLSQFRDVDRKHKHVGAGASHRAPSAPSYNDIPKWSLISLLRMAACVWQSMSGGLSPCVPGPALFIAMYQMSGRGQARDSMNLFEEDRIRIREQSWNAWDRQEPGMAAFDPSRANQK